LYTPTVGSNINLTCPSDIGTTNVRGTSSALTTAHTCWRNKKNYSGRSNKKIRALQIHLTKILVKQPHRQHKQPSDSHLRTKENSFQRFCRCLEVITK